MQFRKLKTGIAALLAGATVFSTIMGVQPSVIYAAEEVTNQGNLGFEDGLDGWTAAGNVSQEASGQTGKAVLLGSKGKISRTIQEIPQGSYTVSMWVKGAASSNTAKVTVGGTGGPNSVVYIDNSISADEWHQIAHRNVLVYNGQMTIEVDAGSSSGIYVDEVAVTLDSNDKNPIQNWDFEQDLTGWSAKGTAVIDTENADTGNKAVKLADQSEISQVITVKPDTDYIATVRMKVDEQDTYKTTEQKDLKGEKVLGLFVERETLGNRVNLGVRGQDGAVLRQAPASTEGYALVTVAFRTGPDQTQAEIYANTVHDQNYVDSVTVYENKSDIPYPNGCQRGDFTQTDQTHASDNWISNGDQFAYVDNFDVFEINNDYIKGADMSFLQAIEDCGGKYFANGVQQDALRILSNHGCNSIITMLFVHAGNPVYDWNTLTPLGTSTVGYDGEAVTGRQVIEGYFDKQHSVAIGKRASQLGMTYTPSFHYSDTWISAAKAHMPYDWIEKSYDGRLSNPDINMVETAVYNYVYDTLTAMKEAGVDVIAIKHGNEQDGGLVFPVASGSQYAQHAAVISASSRAARDVYPGSINTIHSNNGHDNSRVSDFFGNLFRKGAEFDGFMFSLYAGHELTNQFVMMNAMKADSTFEYFDYVNVETGFTFSNWSAVEAAGSMGLSKYYAVKSPNGQYNFLLDYMQAPLDMPNVHGGMRGFYYWNTEAIPVYGAGHKAGEAVGGDSRTMFNNGTAGLKEMGSSIPGKPGDMMDSMYAFLHRGTVKAASDNVYTPLRYAGNNYPVGEAEGISLLNDHITLKAGEVYRLQPTVAPADRLLEDYSISYNSSSPEIAEVSKYGFVTGRKAGSAVVTASIGKVSVQANVTVVEADLASGLEINYSIVRDKDIAASGNVSDGDVISGVKPFDKVKFTTSLGGEPVDKAVVFTVSDPETARWYGDTWQTDDNSMRSPGEQLSTSNYDPVVQLNAVKGGTVQVNARSDDGASQVSFQVEIAQTSVTDVSIAEGDTSVQTGRTVQLSARVTPENATFYKVYWTSSDEEIAVVDQNGLVTGMKPGTASIIITSDEDPAVTDSIVLTVTPVQAEEVLLSSSSMSLLVNDSKTLNCMVLPDNTAEKSVTWSVKKGGESIVSVDQNGRVTGLAVGDATVTVSVNDGSGIQAECAVKVQDTPIQAAGMELTEEEVWVQSGYFSPDDEGKGYTKPVYKLKTVFTPADTTNTDITWRSDNEAVASVDEYGFVTAHKSGMAVITAISEDGNFEDSAVIYVPEISEDWENYESGSKGGFTDGNTFTYEVTDDNGDKKLQASVKGKAGNASSINRRSFTPVSDDVVVVDLDWNVGTFTADNRNRGANLSIEDADGNTFLAFTVYPAQGAKEYEMTYYLKNGSTAMPTKNGSVNGDYNYVHGGPFGNTDCQNVGTGFTGSGKVYTIHAVLDFKNRKMSFTVTDKNDPAVTSTISDLDMDSRVGYTDSFGAVAFSHYFNSAASWTTSIDNLAVYNTTAAAESIEYSVDCVNLNAVSGIKLVPVEGALSSQAMIHAEVLPKMADQEVIYAPQGELADVVAVDENGRITIRADKLVSYDNIASITDTEGIIRVSAAASPEVYRDIAVKVGKPNTSEFVEQTVDGVAYAENISLSAGRPVILSFNATGGDGNTDIYSFEWKVTSGNASIVKASDRVAARSVILTPLGEGVITVDFTIDVFSGPVTTTLNFEAANENAVTSPPVIANISGAVGTEISVPVTLNGFTNDLYRSLEAVLLIPQELEVTGISDGGSLTGGALSYGPVDETGRLRLAYLDLGGEMSARTLSATSVPSVIFTLNLRVKEAVAEGENRNVALESFAAKKGQSDNYESVLFDVTGANTEIRFVEPAEEVTVASAVLYTGDGVDLIPQNKMAVSVAFTNLTAIKDVKFGDVQMYYSQERSVQPGQAVYVMIVDASTAAESLNDVDNYTISEAGVQNIMFGDTNEDTYVNAQDALNILDGWLRKPESVIAEDKQILIRNVTCDGRIDTTDVLAVVDHFVNERIFEVVTK